MGIRTLIRYLLGKLEAILQLAGNPWTLVIGLVFVLSAGFAREYDGEDLLHEPWHLLLPLAASLGSSFLLFSLAYLGPRAENTPPFFTAYRSFLVLFWMTAPLAWLYAIPYERFLSPAEAMQANLWTLGVVATWRVVLMIRVLVVLLGYSFAAALFLVMVYADAVVLVALQFVPVSLLSIMGGVRLSEREAALAATVFNAGFVGFCSGPIWLVGALATRIPTRPRWRVSSAEPAPNPSRPLWMLAAASLLIWLAVLPWTQPEQQLRTRVESAFRTGQYREALAEMSAHELTDFPPDWEPPYRSYAAWSMEDRRVVRAAWGEILETAPAPWVRQRFLDRLVHQLNFAYLSEEEIAELGSLLQRSPEATELLHDAEHSYWPPRTGALERWRTYVGKETLRGSDNRGKDDPIGRK
jgi:hypothetical protein